MLDSMRGNRKNEDIKSATLDGAPEERPAFWEQGGEDPWASMGKKEVWKSPREGWGRKRSRRATAILREQMDGDHDEAVEKTRFGYH